MSALGHDQLRGDTVVAVTASVQPDVVLLDLFLGSVGTATPIIGPLTELGARVLVITASDDPVRLAECLEAGGAGVFSKASPFNDLLDMLVDAVRGETVIEPQARAALLSLLRERRAEERRQWSGFRMLTPREAAVLQALMDGRLAEEIAASDGVSVATVRAQIRAVLQKLGVNSQLAAVAMARRAGWPAGT